MRTPRLSAASLVLVLVTLLTTTTVCAQTVSAEKARLQSIQASLAALQASIEPLQAEHSAAQAALAKASSLDVPEKTALDAAQQMLDEALAVFNAEPSPENKARLKNTEFKYALAERKFKKANKQLASAKQTAEQAATKLTAAQQQLAALTTSLAEQQLTLEKTEVAEQKRRNEENLLQQQAAAAEIARLKAELEQQKRREQARQQAEQQRLKAEAEAKALAAAQAREKAAAAQAALTNVAITASEEAAATTFTTIPITTAEAAATSKQAGIIFLSARELVQAEELRLQQALQAPGNKSKDYNKILNIKTVEANAKSMAYQLRPLGNEQYRGKVTLQAGDNIFSIGFNSWPQTVQDNGDNSYIVIFDRSNPEEPRLVYYPESLSDS